MTGQAVRRANKPAAPYGQMPANDQASAPQSGILDLFNPKPPPSTMTPAQDQTKIDAAKNIQGNLPGAPQPAPSVPPLKKTKKYPSGVSTTLNTMGS